MVECRWFATSRPPSMPMAEHDVVAARVGLSAARKGDRCRDQVGDRVSAPPGRSPSDGRGGGESRGRGQTRQKPQGISWITAVIHVETRRFHPMSQSAALLVPMVRRLWRHSSRSGTPIERIDKRNEFDGRAIFVPIPNMVSDEELAKIPRVALATAPTSIARGRDPIRAAGQYQQVRRDPALPPSRADRRAHPESRPPLAVLSPG